MTLIIFAESVLMNSNLHNKLFQKQDFDQEERAIEPFTHRRN